MAKKFKTIPNKKPADIRIHAELYRAIIDHKIPPGTQLQEDKLSAAFKVSRTVMYDERANNRNGHGRRYRFLRAVSCELVRRMIDHSGEGSIIDHQLRQQPCQLSANLEK
jgi:hypothetical protein